MAVKGFPSWDNCGCGSRGAGTHSTKKTHRTEKTKKTHKTEKTQKTR